MINEVRIISDKEGSTKTKDTTRAIKRSGKKLELEQAILRGDIVMML